MPTPADIIPDDWQNWSAARPELIRPLTIGQTNRSFLLTTGNSKLVLRWNSPISAELDLNRQAEEQALRQADQAGLSAPLIYCDPSHRYLVTRFLDGYSWNQSAIERDTALSKLARLTQNIHQLPRIQSQLDIRAKVSSYWQSIQGNTDFTQSLRLLDHQASFHIDAAESMNRHFVLCHNDLQPENLILGGSGQLYAIDWEYAASGDPYYDLAVITEEHRLQGAEQQVFLEEYLQRPLASNDLQRLGHWRVIYVYLSILWYAIQHTQSTTPDIGLDTKITVLEQHLSQLMADF